MSSNHIKGLSKGLIDSVKAVVENQQLDEISKKTLSNYVNKATDSMLNHKELANMHIRRGNEAYAAGKPMDVVNADRDKGIAHSDKAYNRKEGIKRAVKRLTKEEQEQIDSGMYELAIESEEFGEGKILSVSDYELEVMFEHGIEIVSLDELEEECIDLLAEEFGEDLEEDFRAGREKISHFAAAQKNLSNLMAGKVEKAPMKKAKSFKREQIDYHKERADHHRDRHNHHLEHEKEYESILHGLEHDHKNYGFHSKEAASGAVEEMGHERDKHTSKRIHHEDKFHFHKDQYEFLSNKKYKGKLSEEVEQIDEAKKLDANAAKEKLRKIIQKDTDNHIKKHNAVLEKLHSHFHKEAPKILKKHGFTKTSENSERATWIKPHESGHVAYVTLSKTISGLDAANHKLGSTNGWSITDHRTHPFVWEHDKDTVEGIKKTMMPKFEAAVIDNHEKAGNRW